MDHDEIQCATKPEVFAATKVRHVVNQIMTRTSFGTADIPCDAAGTGMGRKARVTSIEKTVPDF
uniref:Uncharacterized protein n=1 Tax=Hyaloperonospora arabidopsidis (strain Emoy2) TaxID=559515 RepID=M4BJZ1_HYAAE